MKFSNTDSLSCVLLRCMFENVARVGLQVPWSESGNGSIGGSGEWLSSIIWETLITLRLISVREGARRFWIRKLVGDCD